VKGKREPERQGAIAVDHVAAMIEHGGIHGLRGARKHIGWYLASSGAPANDVKAWRRRLCTTESVREVLAGIADFYAQAAETAGREPQEKAA